MEFELDIVHRPGVKHQAVDALSRLFTVGEDTTPLEDSFPCLAVRGAKWSDETKWSYIECWDSHGGLVGDPEVMALVEEEKDILPITTEELFKKQSTGPSCKESLAKVGDSTSLFNVNRDTVLVRRAPLDDAFQKLLPASLRARVLYLSHYPRLAGHAGCSRMYFTLGREFYWPHMANEPFQTLADCRTCVATMGSLWKQATRLTLFAPSKPLELVAMDILGRLSKTEHGNVFVLVITDRFFKLTRAIFLRSTNAASIMDSFLAN